jgi:hypothetical protein
MTDCPHNWEHSGETIHLETVLDDWLGPTMGLISCLKCGQPALMYLVAWQGKQLSERIFAISELSADDVATYLVNVARDYCDLTRKQSETETLIQTHHQNACLIRTAVPDLQVISCGAYLKAPRILPWQDIAETAWAENLPKTNP